MLLFHWHALKHLVEIPPLHTTLSLPSTPLCPSPPHHFVPPLRTTLSLPSTPLCPSPPHHFASQTHLKACKFPFIPDGSSYSYLMIWEFPFTPDRSLKFPFIPEGTGVLVLMFEMSGVVEPSMLKSGYSTMWSCSNMPSYTRPFLNMNLP